MLDIYPDYYWGFHCIAGACPDTCCGQWEVIVDDDTASLYNKLPGPLGQRLRSAMTIDEEGDRILRHTGGYCPLLSSQSGLCEVQLALGHEALCRVCREFPRLCQDYTVFREHSLSLACPEAARRILLAPSVPTLETRGVYESTSLEYDGSDMALLQNVREQMFHILKEETYTVPEKLALCLYLAEAAQERLDGNEPPPVVPSDVCSRLRQATEPNWPDILAFYLDLELLTHDWQALLEKSLASKFTLENCENGDPFRVYPQEFLNLFFDGVYRTLFCAVSDYDLLPRIKTAVLSCALGRYLIAQSDGTESTRLRIHQLYAKEVTHCTENMDALLDACYTKPFFQTPEILSLLR